MKNRARHTKDTDNWIVKWLSNTILNMFQIMELENDFNISAMNIFQEIDITEPLKKIVFNEMEISALKNTVTESKNAMDKFHNTLQTPEYIISKIEDRSEYCITTEV